MMESQNLNVDIKMIKEMVMEKNINIMENYYLKVNIKMMKKMDLEKNMMEMKM